MKRLIAICAVLALAITATDFAHAGSTEIQNLAKGGGISFQAATMIDQNYGTAVAQSEVPATNNSINLGSTTKAFANLYLGGAVVIPTTSEEAVAAAGSIQGDAAALSATKFLHQVTGADGTKGVILPATTAVGVVHHILGTTAAVLKIYPATGGTINGAGANAALSFVTGIGSHFCWSSAADTWICA